MNVTSRGSRPPIHGSRGVASVPSGFAHACGNSVYFFFVLVTFGLVWAAGGNFAERAFAEALNDRCEGPKVYRAEDNSRKHRLDSASKTEDIDSRGPRQPRPVV